MFFYKNAVNVFSDASTKIINPDELSRNLRISHYEGDWYKVRLAQNGESEQRLVKLKQVGNRFLIDNVR